MAHRKELIKEDIGRLQARHFMNHFFHRKSGNSIITKMKFFERGIFALVVSENWFLVFIHELYCF